MAPDEDKFHIKSTPKMKQNDEWGKMAVKIRALGVKDRMND